MGDDGSAPRRRTGSDATRRDRGDGSSRGGWNPSRRRVLAGATLGLGGLGGLGGMLARSSTSESVSMLAAGSLNDAIEHGLRPALEQQQQLQAEARGSAEIAHLVADGTRDPDIVSLADVSLFDAVLDVDWYTEFASNAIVLAYDPSTDAGRRIAETDRAEWYRPLLDDDVSLGRTDPDLDPLGYRTLMTLDLATDHHDTAADLREAIVRRDQRYPETQLLAQFETGGLDAVFAYRNMAAARGYDYVELPAAVDLSDPAHADRYRTASYALPDGTVVQGDVIRYGATIRTETDAAREVFNRHVTGSYLESFGFVVPDAYPQYAGDVPSSIRD